MSFMDKLRELNKTPEQRMIERESTYLAGRIGDLERRVRALEDAMRRRTP